MKNESLKETQENLEENKTQISKIESLKGGPEKPPLRVLVIAHHVKTNLNKNSKRQSKRENRRAHLLV